jgi:hypothetical protein
MSLDYPTGECKSCTAPVIWAVTTLGKPMPVDPEPAEGGNVALSWRAGHVLAEVLSVTKQFGRTGLRKSHFATCPDAAAHRKRRK